MSLQRRYKVHAKTVREKRVTEECSKPIKRGLLASLRHAAPVPVSMIEGQLLTDVLNRAF